MTSPLLRKKQSGTLKQYITPENSNWHHVGFQAIKLKKGECYSLESSKFETCLTILNGRIKVESEGQSWNDLGERLSVFEDISPHALYLTWQSSAQISALTDAEIGVSQAPGREGFFSRQIDHTQITRVLRGDGNNQRIIRNILMADQPAASLLVTEVITPSGHWSSYPPHRHDADSLPEISLLEETYYHRLLPAQGFAFQRVYTDDRSLDECMAVEDGDLVLVPKGYHPVGVPHGYQLYYLNTMAGPQRQWQFKNDPDHEWLVPEN